MTCTCSGGGISGSGDSDDGSSSDGGGDSFLYYWCAISVIARPITDKTQVKKLRNKRKVS